jgi:ABC-2 type transport system ATP-binding protein
MGSERQRSRRTERRKRQPRPLLRCEGLVKDYGSARALGPVSVTINAAEKVALVGHNGSGKSTLLALIAGQLEPSGGRVQVGGFPAGEQRARSIVSYLPDTPVLYDDLSLAEHLDYLSRLHGTTPTDQQSNELLDAFGLIGRVDDLPADYSRGLRQKAAISIGVCRPYRLLLVDEPFSGLDRRGRSTLLELLDQVARSGGSVLVATHDEHAEGVFDRVITLEDGEIVGDTAPESNAEL